MPSDTFAETVKELEAVAAQFTHRGCSTPVSEMVAFAARLLEAAGRNLRSIAEELGLDPDEQAVIESLPSIARGTRDACEQLRTERDAASARIAELEGDPRLKLLYSVGCGPETICAMLREEDAKVMAGDISAASGMVMWVKNHAALTPPAPAMPDGARPVRREVLAGEAAELLILRIRDAEQSAELTTLRQRLAEAEKELAGVLDLIPKDHIVRVREGGGPENVAATVAVSVGRVVHKFAEAAADAARWEGAARAMAKAIGLSAAFIKKRHGTMMCECGAGGNIDPDCQGCVQFALYAALCNPTASALVREGEVMG